MLCFDFPVWNRDELRQALMPTLEKLYKQEPESLPFRQPVDPIALAIPVSKFARDCVVEIFKLKKRLAQRSSKVDLAMLIL